MTLKRGEKVVENCVCVACSSMFAGDTRPISAERRYDVWRRPISGGGEGTTAPIHPAGSGPGLPLLTREDKTIIYIA